MVIINMDYWADLSLRKCGLPKTSILTLITEGVNFKQGVVSEV